MFLKREETLGLAHLIPPRFRFDVKATQSYAESKHRMYPQTAERHVTRVYFLIATELGHSGRAECDVMFLRAIEGA
jgi:hypothetical protein